MAKIRAVRPKTKGPPTPRAGLPCLILVVAGMILLSMLIYSMIKAS